jgi:hypothetical protein
MRTGERGGKSDKCKKGHKYWPETPKPRRLSARGFALTTWTADSAAIFLAPRGQPLSELSSALSNQEAG